jgi:DNA-directed RNA polymerase subunit F
MTKTEIEECKAIIAKWKAQGRIGQRSAGIPLTHEEHRNVEFVNKLSELRENLMFVKAELAKWQGTRDQDIKVRLLEQRQRDINAEIKEIEADGTTTKSRAA